MVPPCLVLFVYSWYRDTNSFCHLFYVTCYFVVIASFPLSNFIRSCNMCLFIICVVLIISGTPINHPHDLLVSYFSTSFFWHVFLSRPFSFPLECSNIQMLSYSSTCYSNLALLTIFSYMYIYLCRYFSHYAAFSFTHFLKYRSAFFYFPHRLRLNFGKLI